MKLMLIEDEKKEQDKFKKLAEKMNDVTFVNNKLNRRRH